MRKRIIERKQIVKVEKNGRIMNRRRAKLNDPISNN